ncbi:mercuric ion transport protein [Sinorhizobium kostiense]|uniref:Mercuric ion transport protein n=1 Tax=Sinorhizobium kostiense TaxID=76747 RepID=A0ABS4R0K4_9HYPH|nr:MULTISPECIES: mercury transport protein [Sinorhizobium/Ensifer group]MBP2236420.1 mercuric ion transport protein [Sinorhizobium kostiense]
MTDRTAIRAGVAGAVLVAICCAAPLVALSLPLAGLGVWLAGAGLVVLPLMATGLGLVA